MKKNQTYCPLVAEIIALDGGKNLEHMTLVQPLSSTTRNRLTNPKVLVRHFWQMSFTTG